VSVRLSSLTLRARLLVLGGCAAAALLALAVVVSLLMAGIGTKTTRSSQADKQAQVLSHAYESWIRNDGQDNMYAAIVALRDPSQQKLADVTWGQAASAYQASYAQLRTLRSLLQDPIALAQLRTIQTSLAAYNAFSAQLRKAALAGNARRAVYIQTLGNLAPSNALPLEFTRLRDALETTESKSVAAARTSASTGTLIVLIVTALALPLLIVLALTTIRSIMTGVKHVEERGDQISHAMAERLRPGLEALARGDFSVHLAAKTKPEEVQRRDELGDIMRTTEQMRETIIDCYHAYNVSTEQLREMVGQVAQTAVSVDSTSKQMASSAEETGKATSEIAQAIEHVAHGAERQVQIIETARRAADDVTAAVTRSAEQAEQTAEVAIRARASAQQGVGAAEQADNAMQAVRDSSVAVTAAIGGLAAKSEQIGAIVQTITGIAEQTNLLALNAAIEAARAGEQGRGFAVVAEEVRKLAEDSQTAAHEISGLIGAIQTETDSVVQVVEDGAKKTADGASVVAQTREAFLSIGEAVDDMSGRVEQIATAAQQITASAAAMQESIGEAAAVAEESSASTEQVSAATEQTSASTQQIAASAHELAQNAASLDQLVAQFQLTASHAA
jgi:methyl-accepting chemotaxis protein